MKGFKLFKFKHNESGQIVVLFAVAAAIIVGVGALVTDIGYQRLNKQKMKTTADAAALAGAMELPNTTKAQEEALKYCELNGLADGENGVEVQTVLNPYGTNPNWYKVTITKPTNFLFGKQFGFTDKSLTTYSTAEYRPYAQMSTTGSDAYGTTTDLMKYTLQVKGPNSDYNEGDPISVTSLEDGSENPDYNSNGYNFILNVPSDYSDINGTSVVKVEVFDADHHISEDSEIDDGISEVFTVYTLYAPDDTPNDYSDDVMIGQATVGDEEDLSGQWVELTNSNSDNFTGTFEFNAASYGYGNYRINVHSTSGDGSNGFSLRGGPPDGSVYRVSGEANINPNNSPQNEFYFIKGDGTVITRDDLHSGFPDYTGPATVVFLKPKGNGNQNTLFVNDQLFELKNSQSYYFADDDMTIHLYNDHRNSKGKAMGKWWIGISADTAVITSNGEISLPFSEDNGTSIYASGKLPVKFIRNETVDVTLGYVPEEAAGGKLHIKKFDTDTGSESIIYRCDTLAGTWTGELAGNGEYVADEIEIPEDYSGGTWYAHFTAGSGDVSTWWMWYEGIPNGEAGFVGLVE